MVFRTRSHAEPLYATRLPELTRPPTRAAQKKSLSSSKSTIKQTKLNNMAEATKEEIQERFASAGANLEPDVIAELQSIMRLHSIDVEELWYKWESYSMKMGSDDMKLNIETARALKKDVLDGLERDNRSKQHLQSNKRAGATPRAVNSSGDVFGM